MENEINSPFILIQGNVMYITQFFTGSPVPAVPAKTLVVKREKPDTPDEPEADGQDTDDDFVKKDFRIASEGIMWGHGYPIEYPAEVLKKGLETFPEKLTLFKDHCHSVDCIAGYGTNFRFEESGLKGIDGTLCFDKQVAPILARNVETGAANKCSITWKVIWEQSHDMKERDFWDAIGMEIDDELVRIIVVEIVETYEVSSVWQGADSTAMAHQKEWKENLETYAQNQKENKAPGNETQTPGMEVNMDEKIQKIITQFNSLFGKQCLTLEQLNTEMSNIQKENKKDKDTITALEAQVNELTPHKELAGQFMTALRQDVTRLKKIANNGELDPVEETTINNSDYETLIKTQAMLDKRVNAMVPMQCEDCGSTNVTRRSSVEKEPEVRGENANSSEEKPQKVSWGKPANTKEK